MSSRAPCATAPTSRIGPGIVSDRITAPERRNLVFAINSLTAGGAERVLMDLLRHLEAHLAAFAVQLVLLDAEEERHVVPGWVNKHVLDANFRMLKSTALLTRLLSRLQPVVTLSFLARANCANVISSRILGRPCIISERTHPTSYFGPGLKGTINKASVRLTYPLADRIIAVSEGTKNDLIDNFGVPPLKVSVVHNPLDEERIKQLASAPPAVPLPDSYILGIGRLVPSKNFRLLIEAYRASNVSDPLIILGDGPEFEYLQELLSRYALDGRVILPGYVTNPYPIIRAARCFVSSSNTEGFPNALVEAMALGCPVVATDCGTGPMEILMRQTGPRCSEVTLAKYGILVPTNSIECLAEAIQLAVREDIRAKYSRQGRERARDFGLQSSVEQYWSAIREYACCA